MFVPPVRDRHNPGPVPGDVLEDGLREVEVVERGVAPPACIVGECVIGRAEVGGGDHDGRR